MTDPQRLDPERLAALARPPKPADSDRLPADHEVVVVAVSHARLTEAWESAVPARFRAARLADFADRAGHDDLVDWAQDEARPNLVLLGPVGVGKTRAATAAVRGAFAAGSSLIFAPVGELLDRLDWRRPDSAAWMAELMAVDLLVVDDLGAERSNEWTGERLYAVINRRWLDELPTVATTNLEPDQLAEALGERTYSRLVGGATVLRLAGPDRRRNATT